MVVSSKRISRIQITVDDVTIDIYGGSEEEVKFTYIYDNKLINVTCVLSNAGTSRLSAIDQICLSLWISSFRLFYAALLTGCQSLDTEFV